MGFFPYMGAIKSLVQMAFPGKMVSVRCEDSPLHPNEILIKAMVNDYGTYVCSNAEFSEKAIWDFLTAQINEATNNENQDYRN